MSHHRFQDILTQVERPSRYLGSEINVIRKDPDQTALSIALAFPDLYEIGTSHFGLQILYHIINSHDDMRAERVFAPGRDLQALLRSKGIPLPSLESATPLQHFDIIGFSLLYELDYTNILTMLDLADIPFYATMRDTKDPIIIAGGPCACNPEPVADFFDAIVIGDGEAVIVDMARAHIKWKQDGAKDKTALLDIWAGIEGVYIPAFFKPIYDSQGLQTLLPLKSDYRRIRRTIVADLNQAPFPDTPILPYGKPIHDRLRLEISRGCSRGCRFCQAGMIYRPVRERMPETLLSLSQSALDATGYEDISLLSLSTGDYGCLATLIENLMTRCESDHIAVSLPSIRAGRLTPDLMRMIKRVRKTGFTIAPEAGSQRLRNVINKNLTHQDIFDTVENAFRLGWQVIKLYFMIGLPTETEKDLEAMIDMVQALRRIKKPTKGRSGGNINVSVTTFIPKPHTPFQWAPQLSLNESTRTIDMLKHRLDLAGIRFKWQHPKVSFIEGLWSRGDRRLSTLLEAAWRRGCQFDGWSDHFDFHAWQQAFEDVGIDPAFFITRTRKTDEPLPWDHIDTRIDKDFLVRENHCAQAEKTTPDCRGGNCNACGACDFKQVAPVTYDICKTASPATAVTTGATYIDYRVSFSKCDYARFFSHLEMVNIFLRALRRAGIPMKYSQGFHPLPKVSFEDSLPIGIESRHETLYLSVDNRTDPSAVINGLNLELPEGLHVFDCRPAPPRSQRRCAETVFYEIELNHGFFDENALKSFHSQSVVMIRRTNKKGKVRNINLKEVILNIEVPSPARLQLSLRIDPGLTVRPIEAVAAIFPLSRTTLAQARVVKLKIKP